MLHRLTRPARALPVSTLPVSTLPVFALLVFAAFLPALTACDLSDFADDDVTFVWPAGQPDGYGEVHFESGASLPVTLQVTNPFEISATLRIDEVVLRPEDQSSAIVYPAPGLTHLGPHEVRVLTVGDIRLLPADRSELAARGVITADDERQQRFDIVSATIVLVD